MDDRAFKKLSDFLVKVPAVTKVLSTGTNDDGNWWVKFDMDIEHPLIWQPIQEMGCVLNYLSVTERLPTAFIPVSPAPYLNGGPEEYLSWVIECHNPDFRPGTCAEWLIGRLPNPVDDLTQWEI